MIKNRRWLLDLLFRRNRGFEILERNDNGYTLSDETDTFKMTVKRDGLFTSIKLADNDSIKFKLRPDNYFTIF